MYLDLIKESSFDIQTTTETALERLSAGRENRSVRGAAMNTATEATLVRPQL
jgi:hypothetical protein